MMTQLYIYTQHYGIERIRTRGGHRAYTLRRQTDGETRTLIGMDAESFEWDLTHMTMGQLDHTVARYLGP